VHQNVPLVNAIWRRCRHLADGLQPELLAKISWVHRMEAAGKRSYHKRFLSAEGCYSHAAAHTAGVRIRIARKQVEHSIA
jgi:hypothetical protein